MGRTRLSKPNEGMRGKKRFCVRNAINPSIISSQLLLVQRQSKESLAPGPSFPLQAELAALLRICFCERQVISEIG